jgi:hypothetical protein
LGAATPLAQQQAVRRSFIVGSARPAASEVH